jgi:splicing suppressor protein 51
MKASMKMVSMFFLVATDTMTIPLTILAALEDTIEDLSIRKKLEIHLVGATGREAQQLVLFEEFLHLLPKLENFKVVLVGPHSIYGDGDPDREIVMECCPACTARGRKRIVSMRQKLYHDYAQTARYQKPDLAVLFHSGRSQEEEESWLPTTAFLVDSGTVTLCTTYNKREATEEVEELDQLGVKFIKRPEVNKWRSLVPIPEFMEVEDNYSHMNNYRYIFKGKERRNIGGLISEGVD